MADSMARYRLLATLAACLPLATLGGCAGGLNTLHAQSRVNPVSMASYPVRPTDDCPLVQGSTGDTRVGAIDLDCFRFPEATRSTDRATLAYALATKSDADRNRLTSILLKHSDDVCTLELGRLTANEAITNSALSILNTGLSTAATIVTGELANSILSGGAGFVGASRDHLNVHVYRNTIAQAVSQVITAERKKLHDDIKKNYIAKVGQWSVDEAIRSVNQYHAQCSFYKGLELLLKAADNNTDLEAYRDSLAARSRIRRIDEEIARLRREAKSLTGANKDAVEKRIADLLLERSRIGTSEGDAPPDPVGEDAGGAPTDPPPQGSQD